MTKCWGPPILITVVEQVIRKMKKEKATGPGNMLVEMQNDIYARFIDYTKALDKVKHKNMLKILRDLQFDGKDIRLVTNLYLDQTAAIRINTELGEWKSIR